MPPDRTSTPSGPFIRNRLLHLNQYGASIRFKKVGKWDRTQFDDMYVVDGTVARTVPVDITVVCDLSSDLHFLRPQGNYSSKFMQTPDLVARKAKLQFTTQRPSIDFELAADYDETVRRLLNLQEEVAKTPDRRHLILGQQLRLNFNLFEPKDPEELDAQAAAEKDAKNEDTERNSDTDAIGSDGSATVDTDEEDDEMGDAEGSSRPASRRNQAELYMVPPELQEIWREVEKLHRNRIMPVFGVNGAAIPYTHFVKVLKPGTTIVVSFNLIHYTIRDVVKEKPFDCFMANVKEVSILSIPDIGPSRPLSTPKKKGKTVSQTPTTRATLRMSADNFLPAPTNRESPSPSKVRSAKDTPREIDSPATNLASQTDAPLSVPQHPLPPAPSDSPLPINIAAIIAAVAAATNSPAEVDEALLGRMIPVIANILRAPPKDEGVVPPTGASSPSGRQTSVDASNFVLGNIATNVTSSAATTSLLGVLPDKPSSGVSPVEEGEVVEDDFVAIRSSARSLSPSDLPGGASPSNIANSGTCEDTPGTSPPRTRRRR